MCQADNTDNPFSTARETELESAKQMLRRELNEALAREERRLREAAEAQDAYLATIAHDLKNPLTTIMGRIELLKRLVQRQSVTTADVQRHLVPLDAAVVRLSTLLDAISQGRTTTPPHNNDQQG